MGSVRQGHWLDEEYESALTLHLSCANAFNRKSRLFIRPSRIKVFSRRVSHRRFARSMLASTNARAS